MSIKKTVKKIEKSTKKNPRRNLIISGAIGGVIVFTTDHVVNFFINRGNKINDDEDDNKDVKKGNKGGKPDPDKK